MRQIDRIKNELELAGFDLDKPTDSDNFDYSNEIGKAAYEVCKVFCEQGHSGYSASCTLQLIQKLLVEGGTLSPLTNHPDEWNDITIMWDKGIKMYQSKRKSSCFSDDNLKTYYDIDEDDSKGRIHHKLKSREELKV